MNSVALILTGGTISMKFDPAAGGVVPALSPEEIVAMTPGLASIARVTAHEFGRFPGPHMTPEKMLALRDMTRDVIARESPDGVIITHGTDTLEETAFFLDCMLDTPLPVIVTGAMKNASQPAWDGPENLCNAARIAVAPAFRGQGVLVCLAGEINAASEVSKTHTDEIGTFHSFDFGPLGRVTDGRAELFRAPHHRCTIPAPSIGANVPLIKCYAGMTSLLFDHLLDEPIDGLVVEGMGVGNVPPLAFDGIARIVEKHIPVVLVSRCPIGRPHDDYAYYGAGKNLKRIGVIFGDYLNGQKARIKLICALGMTRDHETLRELFEWAG